MKNKKVIQIFFGKQPNVTLEKNNTITRLYNDLESSNNLGNILKKNFEEFENQGSPINYQSYLDNININFKGITPKDYMNLTKEEFNIIMSEDFFNYIQKAELIYNDELKNWENFWSVYEAQMLEISIASHKLEMLHENIVKICSTCIKKDSETAYDHLVEYIKLKNEIKLENDKIQLAEDILSGECLLRFQNSEIAIQSIYKNVETGFVGVIKKIKTLKDCYINSKGDPLLYQDADLNWGLIDCPIFFNEYSKILLFFLIAIVLSVVILMISYLISSKIPDNQKLSTYECGFDPYSDSKKKFNIKFYVIGIMFVLFDIEILILISWCLSLSSSNSLEFWIIIEFLLELGLSFIYGWIIGAFDWKKNS